MANKTILTAEQEAEFKAIAENIGRVQEESNAYNVLKKHITERMKELDITVIRIGDITIRYHAPFHKHPIVYKEFVRKLLNLHPELSEEVEQLLEASKVTTDEKEFLQVDIPNAKGDKDAKQKALEQVSNPTPTPAIYVTFPDGFKTTIEDYCENTEALEKEHGGEPSF